MKRMQYEKKCSMEKTQHETSATCKQWNMKRIQHKKSTP